MPYTPYTYTDLDDPAREDEGLFGPRSVTWRVPEPQTVNIPSTVGL